MPYFQTNPYIRNHTAPVSSSCLFLLPSTQHGLESDSSKIYLRALVPFFERQIAKLKRTRNCEKTTQYKNLAETGSQTEMRVLVRHVFLPQAEHIALLEITFSTPGLHVCCVPCKCTIHLMCQLIREDTSTQHRLNSNARQHEAFF